MSEVELVQEILRQVLSATRTIARRFAPIASAEDFVRSEAGLEKLDANECVSTPFRCQPLIFISGLADAE